MTEVNDTVFHTFKIDVCPSIDIEITVTLKITVSTVSLSDLSIADARIVNGPAKEVPILVSKPAFQHQIVAGPTCVSRTH